MGLFSKLFGKKVYYPDGSDFPLPITNPCPDCGDQLHTYDGRSPGSGSGQVTLTCSCGYESSYEAPGKPYQAPDRTSPAVIDPMKR